MRLSRSRAKVPYALGAYAGVLALSLVAYSFVGAVWGLLRPGYSATVLDSEQIQLGTETNVEFISFLSFVSSVAVIAMLIGGIVFVRSPRSRSLWMMLWLALVSAAGSMLFLHFGELSTALIHGHASADSLEVGEQVTYVPTVNVGIVGYLVAPFWSCLVYWCSYLVSPDMSRTMPEGEAQVELPQDSADSASV